MKRKLTFLLAAFALLTFLTPPQRANAQTGDTTIIFPAAVYEGQTIGSATATIEGVTIASTNGYYHSGKNHVRELAPSTLTITSNYAISKVVIRCTGGGYAHFVPSVGTLSHPLNNGIMTWTGLTDSIAFFTQSQSRWTSIEVTHGSEVTDITATPTISPEAGQYYHPINVTIDCATEGATIYYTTNGYNPTTSSTVYTGSFPLSQNKTIKAMAVKSGMLNSGVASAYYSFSLPVPIANVRNGALNYTYRTAGIVTGIDGESVYIQDSTAAIVVYGNTEPVIGDEIVVSGKLKRSGGMLRLTDPTIEILSHDNVVTPEVRTVAEIKANANYTGTLQAKLVRIEEATVVDIISENHITTTTICQGNDSIIIYNYLIPGAVVGRTISLTGNVAYTNAARIVNPRDFTYPASTEPLITATPPNISLSYDGTESIITVSYENLVPSPVNTSVFFCDANGETAATYDWISTVFDDDMNVHYTLAINPGSARTAYFKVRSYDSGSNLVSSNLVSIMQSQYINNDASALPFHWDGNSYPYFTDKPGATLHSVGGYDPENFGQYVMKFDNTGDYLQVKTKTQPGQVDVGVMMIGGGQTSYFIVQGSSDGIIFTDIETLTISGSQNSVLNLHTINAFPTTHRYVRLYFVKGSNIGVGSVDIAVADNTPGIVINEPEINLTAVAQEGSLAVFYRNIDFTNEPEIQSVEADGSTPATYSWITTSLNSDRNMVYQVMQNEGDNRTAYFKVHGYDANANDIYSTLIAITQHSATETHTYTLVSSLSELIPGKHYIIVGIKDGEYYAMGGQSTTINGGIGNSKAAIKVTSTGNTISTYETTVHELTFNGIGPNGYWTIYDNNPQGSTASTGFLYASSGSNNTLQSRLHNQRNPGSEWVIGITAENNAEIIAQGNIDRNTIRFHSPSLYFSCYHENNDLDDIYLYKKDDDPGYEFIMDIYGYNNSTTGNFYLLSTPVDSLNPTNVPEMLQNTYDLYSFDPNKRCKEWRNYKIEPFNLAAGKGYLYAHNTDAVLKINTDVLYSGDGTFVLSRSESDLLTGWNLVGNPYSSVAHVDGAFYRMDNNGLEIIASTSSNVAPMEGIFVLAANDGETITFNNTAPTAPTRGGNIIINLGETEVISRAIIRFDEGRQLPKFMLDESHPNIYIPQNDDDYTIVRGSGQGEMPIHFNTTESGSFTLSVEVENAKMDYLHLIDTQTSADIDLLENPTYTFTAQPTDNINRFKIVYATSKQ